jgi:hypothetical protein
VYHKLFVHKVLLADASAFFKRLLLSGLSESVSSDPLMIEVTCPADE